MTIAIVSDYYHPQLGGITEHMHSQAPELVRRGRDLAVLTPRLAITPRTVDGRDLPTRAFDVVNVVIVDAGLSSRAARRPLRHLFQRLDACISVSDAHALPAILDAAEHGGLRSVCLSALVAWDSYPSHHRRLASIALRRTRKGDR